MLLVDTGSLLATTADAGPLVTTALVIGEAAYLIDQQLGPVAEAALFTSIADGAVRVENLEQADWARIAELVAPYADLRLGGTDASPLALGKRLKVTRVVTVNHRDFRVVRPHHVNVLELLP